MDFKHLYNYYKVINKTKLYEWHNGREKENYLTLFNYEENYNYLLNNFSQYDNVNINYGDFYKKYNDIPDNSVDIIHIDIANTGEIYDLAINNYITKLTDKGILILEGGSEERDNVEWMNKYNKSKIQPIIKKYENNFRIKNIGIFPSLTIIAKNYTKN